MNMAAIILLALMMSVLSMGTLNINGNASDRMDYLSQKMKEYDLLLIQEHWLHEKQLSKLHTDVHNVCSHGISGMNSSLLLHGS